MILTGAQIRFQPVQLSFRKTPVRFICKVQTRSGSNVLHTLIKILYKPNFGSASSHRLLIQAVYVRNLGWMWTIWVGQGQLW